MQDIWRSKSSFVRSSEKALTCSLSTSLGLSAICCSSSRPSCMPIGMTATANMWIPALLIRFD